MTHLTLAFFRPELEIIIVISDAAQLASRSKAPPAPDRTVVGTLLIGNLSPLEAVKSTYPLVMVSTKAMKSQPFPPEHIATLTGHFRLSVRLAGSESVPATGSEPGQEIVTS